MLKGWVDRVFAMGALFGGEFGLFEQAAMQGRRAVALVTTGGPAHAFDAGGQYGDLDAFLFHLHRGILQFVGYDVHRPVVTFEPAHLDADQRSAALDSVRIAFASIEQRRLVDTAH